MYLSGRNVLITGGTGSLGTAILKRANQENWGCSFTVFARNETKIEQTQRSFPGVNCVIGDVRDLDWLRTIVPGHDIVIHAAALKIVPVAEINVKEAITCNVDGTKNVAIACAESKVERAILISSDKACLSGSCVVTLEDGTRKHLRKLVEEKYDGKVVTVDPITRERKTAKVIGWHKNKRLGRKMIRVSYVGAHKHKGYLSGPIVTEDHLILTTLGWKQAGDLTEDDILITHEPKPNRKQMELLIGTILGDASLSKPRKLNERSQLIVGQAAKEKDWLNIKLSLLDDFNFNQRKTKDETFLSASSKYYACMQDLRNYFYPDSIKIVPRKLIEEYFSPVLMATWYLDDGCVSCSNNNTTFNARLSTHGFSKDDVDWLAEFLSKKGFKCYSYPNKRNGYEKTYYEIRFNVIGTKALFDYIRKAIPESMSHKIDRSEYDKSFWDKEGPAESYCAKAVIDKTIYQHPHGVYCLDIEDTHAFVSSEVVVHNCGPTFYGITKRLGEGLFREANNWSYTEFIAVRYGNVLRSANSVVPFFEKQIANDKPFTLTSFEMSRFWLSMKQAVDLIFYALETSPSGTVTVPKAPAMLVKDLAQTLDPGREMVEIGIRPGERLNETLVIREEAMHTIDIGDYFLIYPPQHKIMSNLPSQYEYTSDKPNHWLTPEELRALLRDS